MLHRLAISALLAICLALTSLAAVVAETRMAAAGTYCGTGAPQILLDRVGLPVLDGEGTPIAAPDCATCNLTFALAPPQAEPTSAATLVSAVTPVMGPQPTFSSLQLDRHARAPPRLA